MLFHQLHSFLVMVDRVRITSKLDYCNTLYWVTNEASLETAVRPDCSSQTVDWKIQATTHICAQTAVLIISFHAEFKELVITFEALVGSLRSGYLKDHLFP